MHAKHKPETAARLLSTGQMIFAPAALVAAIAIAAAFGPVVLLKVAVALVIAFYIVFIIFKVIIWCAAGKSQDQQYVLPAEDDPDGKIDSLFATLKEKYGKVETLVHAVAFAPPNELRGDFLNTTREGFRVALDVSVYSLIAVTRAAAPLMTEGGSIMTLSFYAAEKVVPNYNVMAVAKAGLESTVRYLAWSLGSKNIRVNAISAGPIKTLAARGVGDLSEMMKTHADRAPLHRNVDQLEVGGAALFLASELSSAITGETLYVDCGYNIMGF